MSNFRLDSTLDQVKEKILSKCRCTPCSEDSTTDSVGKMEKSSIFTQKLLFKIRQTGNLLSDSPNEYIGFLKPVIHHSGSWDETAKVSLDKQFSDVIVVDVTTNVVIV